MAPNINPVVISAGVGRKWWHIPDSLWLKRESLRERRLRITLARHILPFLQELEAVQTREDPSRRLYLKGRTLAEVEQNPVLLELAMYLYEMALADGLVRHSPAGSPVSIRGDLDGRVGSCGISPNEISRRYFRILAAPILKAAGYGENDIGIFLSQQRQTRVRNLGTLRILSALGKDTINEMRFGLGSLDGLMEKSPAWLKALGSVNAPVLLRTLRDVAPRDFPEILDWPEELLTAANKGLNDPEKIRALGVLVLEIKNPLMFVALGTWPTAKDENGRTISRISHIRNMLGDKIFTKVITGSPELVKSLGAWPEAKIKLYKPYLGMLTGPAMGLLDGLEEDQRLALLSGLVEKLEMPILAKALKKKEGLVMLQGVVNEVKTMNRNSRQEPGKLKKLVCGTYFDDYFGTVLANA